MKTRRLPAPTQETTVPANRLTKSPRNVRKERRGGIAALANSILRQGLLQNLVVSRDGDDYPVEAGERRRLAIARLVKKKRIPPDWPVRVIIVNVASSTAVSTIENVHREPMHPADQFEAFTQLNREGWTIERIADAFGMRVLTVERYFGFTKAAPALLALLRADEITTEELAALCATDDHERQVSTWRNAPSWMRSAAQLRRSVLGGDIETARDPRVAFIGGVQAFVSAGGHVRRDLFSAEGQDGLISDVALLERLVAEKLETEAERVRAEGWGWVEVWPTGWNYSQEYRFGRISKTAMELTAEASDQAAMLADERATLEALVESIAEAHRDEADDEGADRYSQALARLDEIDEILHELETTHSCYDREAMATSGAIVGIESGKLRIERGFVKPEDRAQIAKAVGDASAILGGRETEIPGRKRDALSDALTRSLFGHRNLAAQVATAANPQIAKVLLACLAVHTIRDQRWTVPADLRILEGVGTRSAHPITDDSKAEKKDAFKRIGDSLVASLPTDPVTLWDALMDLPDRTLDTLVAYLVACSVSLDRDHKGLTERFLTALGFDVADHFTTDGINYLGRVSKPLILEALEEAGALADDQERITLLALRKGDLVASAQARLAGTRWVPALIRTPGSLPVHSPAPSGDAGEEPAAAPAAGTAAEDGAPPEADASHDPLDVPAEAPAPAEMPAEETPVELATAVPAGQAPRKGSRGRTISPPKSTAKTSPRRRTVATKPAPAVERDEAAETETPAVVAATSVAVTAEAASQVSGDGSAPGEPHVPAAGKTVRRRTAIKAPTSTKQTSPRRTGDRARKTADAPVP